MAKELFRKKSLERIASPEDLNSYMQVTNPSIWFALAAIILLIIGAVVWAAFSRLESSVDGVAVSEGGSVVCYVSEANVADVAVGTIVRIDGEEYYVSAVCDKSEDAESALSDYAMSLAGFMKGERVYACMVDAALNTGNYACCFVTESISPFTFLFESTT